MGKNRYSAEKRHKEIKKQKRQQEKKQRKEQTGSSRTVEDEKALINEYLGIESEPVLLESDSEQD